MPRIPSCRRILSKPLVPVFRPAGVPECEADSVVMTLDEFEAIRLADLEGLYQEQAAGRMKVSRPTFSRIIESGHRKVAEALFYGKALHIEGGPVHVASARSFRCPRCSCAGAGTSKCRKCGTRRPPQSLPLPQKEGGSCRCVSRQKRAKNGRNRKHPLNRRSR